MQHESRFFENAAKRSVKNRTPMQHESRFCENGPKRSVKNRIPMQHESRFCEKRKKVHVKTGQNALDVVQKSKNVKNAKKRWHY